MQVLTIFNTIAILGIIFYLAFKGKYLFEIRKTYTDYYSVFLGWEFTLWRSISAGSRNSVFVISIPIRNKKKAELEDEINYLMSKPEQARRQILNAQFSWLKTWVEVWDFQNKYEVVDKKYIEKLVTEFAAKYNQLMRTKMDA